jgi:hypothetical protein
VRAILFVALLAAGCAGRQHEPDNLAESIRSFNEGVRWERWSVAATRVPDRERSQFVEDMDLRAEDLKITDYEIVNVASRGPREARVLVKMSWYRPSVNTVHETHAVQTWEKQGRAWMMVAEARLRGAEMPGLPDREPAAAVAP